MQGASPTPSCAVGPVLISRGGPLAIIAGPCVLESLELALTVATTVSEHCAALGLPFVFKGSFDKANRSSIRSGRGPGMGKGLEILARIKDELGVPVTTDVHEPAQAAMVAEVVDLLQIPAFLCRQTDLLVACAETGRALNVKKGQFLSPAEMRHVVTKVGESGGDGLMLTERGTFFGYHRLVNDFIGLGDLMDLGAPVCFDVTHSTQLPGGGAHSTDGRPERADLLLRAAVAAGVDALFIECHPRPEDALSDASTQQPLEHVGSMLHDAVAIRRALQESRPSE